MKRLICPEEQIDIFPPAVMVELFNHPAPAAPLPPLPFPRNKEVSVDRAAKILGTHINTVRRLIKTKKIRGYKLGRGAQFPFRVLHESLVTYCDQLRVDYGLPLRKGGVALGRLPDNDILPFPMSETLTMVDVEDHLGVTNTTVVKLLEAGEIAAYKLGGGMSHWRIHRGSFAAYLRGLEQRANQSSRLRQPSTAAAKFQRTMKPCDSSAASLPSPHLSPRSPSPRRT